MAFNHALYKINGGVNTEEEDRRRQQRLYTLFQNTNMGQGVYQSISSRYRNFAKNKEPNHLMRLIYFKQHLQNYDTHRDFTNAYHLILFNDLKAPLNDVDIIKESILINKPVQNWTLRNRFFEYTNKHLLDNLPDELEIKIHKLYHRLIVKVHEQTTMYQKQGYIQSITLFVPTEREQEREIQNVNPIPSQHLTPFMRYQPLVVDLERIHYFQFLRELNLSNVKLECSDVILEGSNIQHINLCNIKMKLPYFFDSLMYTTSIKSIKIENLYPDENLEDFEWECETALPELETLQLKNCDLSGVIPTWYYQFPKLRYLNISDNPNLTGTIDKPPNLSINNRNTKVIIKRNIRAPVKRNAVSSYFGADRSRRR